MKCPILTLVLMIGAIFSTQSAYANQDNFPLFTEESNQAAVLTTEPVTINSTWGNVNNQTNNLKNTAGTISLSQEQGCQKLSPLDFISNPDAIFKQCQKPANNQTSPNYEPIEYLKVPRLDSGVQLTITKF